ncbi:MAG: TonB-dependent receptor, partial [Burkholderiaceae bacterium]
MSKNSSVMQLGKLLPFGAARGVALTPHMAAAQATAPAPAAPDTQLPEVKVDAASERESKGYQGGTTRVGKTQQLPKEIPQSVTVISEQLMVDRNADTLREALRNVAGLTFNAGEGGRIGDNITLRGYSAVGDLYLDGIRDIAQYNRETFNLEQIDILRGSGSMLFGRGSTGGVINQVSKKPYLVDRNEVALTAGSFDYKRIVADLNKVLWQDAALRVNLMGTETDSFRDAVDQKRVGVAPSLRFGTGTANEFLLAYYYLKDDNVPDYGVPYFNGKPVNVPVERFYGMANADYERNETGIGTATYIHRFSKDAELRTVLRRADYQRDLWAVAPRLITTPTPGAVLATDATVADGTASVNRGRQARGGEEKTLTSQTDFTTKFNAAGMTHELLTGLELAREKAERWSNSNAPAGSTAIIANPRTTLANPDSFVPLPADYLKITRVP